MRKKIFWFIPLLLASLLLLTKERNLSAQVFESPYRDAKVGEWILTSHQGLLTKTSCVKREENMVTIQQECSLDDKGAISLSELVIDAETGDILEVRNKDLKTEEMIRVPLPPAPSDDFPLEELGTEKIEVLAGSFEAEHYQMTILGQTTDIWISKDVPFFSPIKVMLGSTTTLELVDYGRSGALSSPKKEEKLIPKESKLFQNYPNPFNPETWIPFSLKDKARVTIKIYNLTGQLIRTLDLGEREAGEYTTKDKAAYWDGHNNEGEEIASGIYFYQLRAGDKVFTKMKPFQARLKLYGDTTIDGAVILENVHLLKHMLPMMRNGTI